MRVPIRPIALTPEGTTRWRSDWSTTRTEVRRTQVREMARRRRQMLRGMLRAGLAEIAEARALEHPKVLILKGAGNFFRRAA